MCETLFIPEIMCSIKTIWESFQLLQSSQIGEHIHICYTLMRDGKYIESMPQGPLLDVVHHAAFFSCWAWNSVSEFFSTQCTNKSLLIDGSWPTRSHINSFSSSDINCKFLVGQGQRMLAWYCSEPKVNNERLLQLGKELREPGLTSGTLRKLHIGDPTRWAAP